MKKIVAGLLLTIASIASMAPLAHADNYQVEIIVFARDASDGEDSLRSSSELHYPAKTVTLSAENNGGPFQLLPATNLLLNREAGAIEQRKNMRVLVHQAWLWPSEDNAHATAVVLSAGRQFGNHRELEGFIALSAERFLRIDTQLWLSRFNNDSTNMASNDLVLPTAPAAAMNNIPTAMNNEHAGADNYVVSQLFLLREQRRMRSGELHYFDHSRLGLLVQVTPVAAASNAATNTSANTGTNTSTTTANPAGTP